jgi:hypothetical protein
MLYDPLLPPLLHMHEAAAEASSECVEIGVDPYAGFLTNRTMAKSQPAMTIGGCSYNDAPREAGVGQVSLGSAVYNRAPVRCNWSHSPVPAEHLAEAIRRAEHARRTIHGDGLEKLLRRATHDGSGL